jgi:kynurenine formamidase
MTDAIPNTLHGHTVGIDEFEAIYSEVSNWNKWGARDQRGTLNYVTPEKIRQAAGLVRDGRAISLQLPMDENGPQTGAFGRFNPIHNMVVSGVDHLADTEPAPLGFGYADDSLFVFLQSGTQWDALSHIFRHGRMFNGFPADHVSSRGARSLGIERNPTLVSRGVLLDLVAVLNRPMTPGEAVLPDLLNEACRRQDVSVEAGDVLLIRTGDMMARRTAAGWDGYSLGDAPGLSLRSAAWLAQHRVAAVATDTWGVEVRPNEIAEAFQPMHLVLIVSMGLHLGEIWDLEELAADCAQDGRYEFMLVAPSLRITGAVGSPTNPQAIK